MPIEHNVDSVILFLLTDDPWNAPLSYTMTVGIQTSTMSYWKGNGIGAFILLDHDVHGTYQSSIYWQTILFWLTEDPWKTSLSKIMNSGIPSSSSPRVSSDIDDFCVSDNEDFAKDLLGEVLLWVDLCFARSFCFFKDSKRNMMADVLSKPW